MANQFKGEFEFAGHKFRFGIDQICNAEAELGMGFGEMLAAAQRGANIRMARAIFAAAWVPAPNVNFDPTALIEQVGFVQAFEASVSIIRLALPAPQGGGEADPPNANPPDGTGNGS